MIDIYLDDEAMTACYKGAFDNNESVDPVIAKSAADNALKVIVGWLEGDCDCERRLIGTRRECKHGCWQALKNLTKED